MASGAVRELITKVKFQIGQASLSQVNKTMQDVKKSLSSISDKSLKVGAMADTSKAQSALKNLKAQADNVAATTSDIKIGADTSKASNALKDVKKQVDKVSATTSGIKIGADTGKATSALQRLKRALNGIKKNINARVNVDSGNANGVLARIKGQLNSLSGKVTTAYVEVKQKCKAVGASATAKETTSGLGSGLAGVAGVVGGGMAISQIKDTADEMMNLDGRLRTVTKTEKERLDVESELYKRAQESRQSMQAMGDLYFKVARASQEMGFAQKDNLQVTETVAKALAIGGASAQEAEATILQLGQALGSGRLQGDELRSLDENASILMGHVAKYFKTNVAGLKQMGAQGELTSDEVMRAILSASGEIDKEFSKMPMTFGQSMNMMKNSWDRFILGVEQKSSVFSFIARAFTKAFDSMGNKLNDVLTLLGTPDANKMVTITETETGEQKQISETDYYNQKAAENPVLFKTIEGIKKLGEMFDRLDGKTGNLDEQIGGVIETLMKIGLVFAPILAVIGMVDALIALLSPFITLVTSIGSTIMGVLGPILSVGLGPLLAILGAIASVIYFVGENWETVVSWFQPGIESMKEGIAQLQQAWKNLQPFIKAITPLLEVIATVIGGAIVGALSILFRVASWVFKRIADFIEWVAGLLGGLGDTIQWLADGLSGLIDKALQFIGMKGQVEGVNSSITQKWADRAMSGNSVNNTQTNTFNLASDMQLAPAMQSTQTYFAYW